MASIWATVLLLSSLCTAIVVDLNTLYQNILSALFSDPIATKHISTNSWWSMDPNSIFHLDDRIYLPFASNLCIYIVQYNYDHILASYFSQNKILELVCYRYSWPSLYADIQQFCKFCVICMWSKLQHHKPYRSLKQVSIPKTTMEFYFYGLYWETPIILQVWHYSGHSQLAH